MSLSEEGEDVPMVALSVTVTREALEAWRDAARREATQEFAERVAARVVKVVADSWMYRGSNDTRWVGGVENALISIIASELLAGGWKSRDDENE